MKKVSLVMLLCSWFCCKSFRRGGIRRSLIATTHGGVVKLTTSWLVTTDNEILNPLAIMINGLPGAMAAETARVCLERGLTLVPYGFTGKDPPSKQFVVTTGSGFSKSIELIEGPGVNSDADNMMERIKNEYPNCIIVDYTHPSAVLSNIRCYTANACDFVMGTTGVELSKMKSEFEKGENFAVIAPNMAKQIVALQYALDQLSNRFPNAYGGYNLKVLTYICFHI
jgi:4-hydroxy-tetrahydrodipicolinate reductase